MRWLGAGWPDYPWLFGTDGEYTAFAAVAAGQFAPIKAHLRALRDVSVVVNGRSGKIVHEVTPDGAGLLRRQRRRRATPTSPRSSPRAVALVWRWTGDDAFRDDLYPASRPRDAVRRRPLDEDGDGWPEGLGNVEREGMGEEKLDNTVYTIRGCATSPTWREPGATARPAAGPTGRAAAMLEALRGRLVVRRRTARTRTPTRSTTRATTKVFQRHWIGVTPTDAVLPGVRRPQAAARWRPASTRNTTLDQHERPCYTDELGLFHTGTGPTSPPAATPAPAATPWSPRCRASAASSR